MYGDGYSCGGYMKMNHREALKILGLPGISTFADIKSAYRRACGTYHPDRNPAGLEMMKLINGAYQSLSDYEASAERCESNEDNASYSDTLNDALNAVINLGLEIEICGSWIWVSGDTKAHKDVLKAAGYKYAPKKVMWSFCGGKRSTSRGKFSMADIRERHGSTSVRGVGYAKLSG